MIVTTPLALDGRRFGEYKGVVVGEVINDTAPASGTAVVLD